MAGNSKKPKKGGTELINYWSRVHHELANAAKMGAEQTLLYGQGLDAVGVLFVKGLNIAVEGSLRTLTGVDAEPFSEEEARSSPPVLVHR